MISHDSYLYIIEKMIQLHVNLQEAGTQKIPKLSSGGRPVAQASPTRGGFQEPVCIGAPAGGVVRGRIGFSEFVLETLQGVCQFRDG